MAASESEVQKMEATGSVASVKGAAAFYEEYGAHDPDRIRALVEHGRRAYRCDCGAGICTGWQMLNSADVEFVRSRGISLYVEPDDNGYAPALTQPTLSAPSASSVSPGEAAEASNG